MQTVFWVACQKSLYIAGRATPYIHLGNHMPFEWGTRRTFNGFPKEVSHPQGM